MGSAAALTNLGWDAEQSENTYRMFFLVETSVFLRLVVQILWQLPGQHLWQKHNWLFMIYTVYSYLFGGFLQLQLSKNVVQLHCLWDCKMTFSGLSYEHLGLYFIPT